MSCATVGSRPAHRTSLLTVRRAPRRLGKSQQDRVEDPREQLYIRVDLRDVVVGLAGPEVYDRPVLRAKNHALQPPLRPRSHLEAIARERRHVVQVPRLREVCIVAPA